MILLFLSLGLSLSWKWKFHQDSWFKCLCMISYQMNTFFAWILLEDLFESWFLFLWLNICNHWRFGNWLLFYDNILQYSLLNSYFLWFFWVFYWRLVNYYNRWFHNIRWHAFAWILFFMQSLLGVYFFKVQFMSFRRIWLHTAAPHYINSI